MIKFNRTTRNVALQTYLNYNSPVCAGYCVGILNDTVALTLTHVDTVNGTVNIRISNGRVFVAYNLTIFRYARIIGETFLSELST